MGESINAEGIDERGMNKQGRERALGVTVPVDERGQAKGLHLPGNLRKGWEHLGSGGTARPRLRSPNCHPMDNSTPI